MKYIKDRFYNLRKNNLSLEAPAQDLFTCEERTAFSCGLWVQRYDKFLRPPNFWRSFFADRLSSVGDPFQQTPHRVSRSAWRASHHIDSASVSISYHRHQAPTMYRTLPTTLSLELRVQRYDNFLKPPNLRRSFFSSASLVRLTPIIYRCAQRHAHQQNLLTTHKAQTLPKPRSFELRVQRYYNFSNPPNVWRSFFGGGHNEPTQHADA